MNQKAITCNCAQSPDKYRCNTVYYIGSKPFVYLHYVLRVLSTSCPLCPQPFISQAEQKLYTSDRSQVTSVWSAPLLWLVSNYSYSDFVIQINAIIWSVGSSTPITAVLSGHNGTSTVSFSQQQMTQGNVWHIQAIKRQITYTLRTKKILQLNFIFVNKYI